MRKIFALFLLYSTIIAQATSYAAAPTRAYNYGAGQTISSSQVNTNETALYTYLQNGVDVVNSGVITDTNVAVGAGIQYSKLNLAGQIKNTDIVASAGIPYSKLTLTGSVVDGDIVSITSANKVSTASIYGTLPIANGGTGQTTAQAAVDALLPSQGSNSGKFLTTNGSTSSWGEASSPSNVLFQWHGNGDMLSAGNFGWYAGTSPTPTSGEVLSILGVKGTTYQTVFKTKFLKIAGVSTVTVYVYVKTPGSGITQTCLCDIGGAQGSYASNTSDNTTHWSSFTVDVSGLSNGTVYDVAYQMKTDNSAIWAYTYGIIAFGS